MNINKVIKFSKRIMLILLSVMILNSMFFYTNVNAATFSNASFKEAHEYNKVATKILSESNKQSLEFFKLVAKWETYPTTEGEQYDSLKKFISSTKKRFSFVNDYNSTLVKEIQKVYKDYIYLMEEELNKSVTEFINGRVIFIDFLENNLSETQKNYLSFKKDGLNKFLNAHIFTPDNKLAINKIVNGSSADKKEGKKVIKETIERLKLVQTRKVDYVETIEKDGKKVEVKKSKYESPEVIRNYAHEFEKYFNSVLKGDLSKAEYLIGYENDRINGLIPVGNAFYEINEFNNYINIFNNFTDYPTLEVSLDISSKKIEKTLNSLINQTPNTKNIQKLKKLHYEFLYELAEYKKSKDVKKVTKAYEDFYNHFVYLNSYYGRVQQRFSGFNYDIVGKEISIVKENAKSLNPNIKSINALTYKQDFSQDSTAYRKFAIKKDSKEIIKLVIIIIVIIIIVGLIFYGISRYRQQTNNNYSDEYDDTYNNYNGYDDYNDYW